MDNDLVVSGVEVSAPEGMEKEFRDAVRDIVVRIADMDRALSEKLHAEWLDYSRDSVARNGLVLPDTEEDFGYSVYGYPDGKGREMDIRFDQKLRNYEKIPGFFYADKQYYTSDMFGRSLFLEQQATFVLDGKKFAEVLKEEYGLDVRVRDVEFARLSENRGYDIVFSEVRPSLVKVKENIKVKGEDKMKEVKEEKSYARFDLMTSYHYHQDNEAVSKALYNVNFDAMDKEPAFVQDVFRTIAEGKDGTITEVREKDMYWDTRIIGIYCGEEEYLIKATRNADEDNRYEYSTFISVAAPQKELDVFTKKIKNVFEQNHVHGVDVITESKRVSKGYLKSKFDSDKHVLTTDEQKLTMPVKSLGFMKEQMALSATPAPENKPRPSLVKGREDDIPVEVCLPERKLSNERGGR